jgi:hypothetical protein
MRSYFTNTAEIAQKHGDICLFQPEKGFVIRSLNEPTNHPNLVFELPACDLKSFIESLAQLDVSKKFHLQVTKCTKDDFPAIMALLCSNSPSVYSIELRYLLRVELDDNETMQLANILPNLEYLQNLDIYAVLSENNAVQIVRGAVKNSSLISLGFKRIPFHLTERTLKTVDELLCNSNNSTLVRLVGIGGLEVESLSRVANRILCKFL